jgi:hypothetical protein
MGWGFLGMRKEGTRMGAVVDLAELRRDHWPEVLSAVSEAGVQLADDGDDERGWRWYRCCRSGCRVDLGFGRVVPGGGEGVFMFSRGLTWWRRPLGMRRPSRALWTALLAAGGRAV